MRTLPGQGTLIPLEKQVDLLVRENRALKAKIVRITATRQQLLDRTNRYYKKIIYTLINDQVAV